MSVIPRSVALATVLTASIAASAAHAQEVVIATYGGSFAEDTKTCHIAAFEKATGAKATLKLGSSVQFAASLRAMGGKSDFDVAYLDDSLATQLQNEKLLTPIDRSKLSNAADIAPNAWGKDNAFVNFMTAATVIAYNPKLVTTPPTSWADLLDPKYEGKMAIGDITGTSGMHLLLALNRLKGGEIGNQDAGFEAIKPVAKRSVTLYTQADQIVSLFERGEIAIAPWYTDRIGSLADKGVPIAVAYPKEGAVGIRPTIVFPKGAANAELAYKYLDVVLSPEGQKCFAERKYAGPVNTKVKLDDKVAAIVPYGPTYDKLWYPDPEVIAKELPVWTRRWQRQVAR